MYDSVPDVTGEGPWLGIRGSLPADPILLPGSRMWMQFGAWSHRIKATTSGAALECRAVGKQHVLTSPETPTCRRLSSDLG